MLSEKLKTAEEESTQRKRKLKDNKNAKTKMQEQLSALEKKIEAVEQSKKLQQDKLQEKIAAATSQSEEHGLVIKKVGFFLLCCFVADLGIGLTHMAFEFRLVLSCCMAY